MGKVQVDNMIKPAIVIILSYLLSGCVSKEVVQNSNGGYSEIEDFFPKDTLFRVSRDDEDVLNGFCYVNQGGDTVIPYGRFATSFTDTLLTYGIVIEKTEGNQELIAINQKGERLYEVVWYDNGPDYIEDGMFRISRNGKIGYADTTGKIIIEPQFACAQPFSKGKAEVTYRCEHKQDGDHSLMESDGWFYIDKNGTEIE